MLERTKHRWLVLAGLLALPVGLAAMQVDADFDTVIPPLLVGNVHRGYFRTDLHRGASVPDEILVLATPGNCATEPTVEVTWDEEQNYVRVHMEGRNVFDPDPTIERTEGVDYFPNAFWPETPSYEHGRYLLWLIHVVPSATFYYDAQTLDLLGTQYDFETPPANSIPLQLPGFIAVPTDFIDVEPNGDVDWTHEFAYDGLTRGDLPEYAHFFASFVPHNLCTANPYDYTQTSSRPYASPTLPASEAHAFSEFLRNGVIFDITVEPPDYAIFPPISTNVVTYSQALTVAGGIPRGWSIDLEAVFANLAPPIRPWEPATSCENWFKPKRDRSFNACAPVEGGAR